MNICSMCQIKACGENETNKFPKNCPSMFEHVNNTNELYKNEEDYKIAKTAALVEKENYCKMTRIEEIIDFCKRMEYKKIGFAFCMGLKKEMETIYKVFSHYGFEIHSVGCKCGSISKEFLGLNKEDQIHSDRFEPMCNPIGQASYLNECKTEFNILVGLCVGHDTLFIKHVEAPITILAVKDRITGHSPLAPIYILEGYYNSKLFGEK